MNIWERFLPEGLLARLPSPLQRLLHVGPKYGIAEGFAVYGPSVEEGIEAPIDPSSPILQPTQLLRWLAMHGEPADGTRASLAALDRLLPEALADDKTDADNAELNADADDTGPQVQYDAALLMGSILVAEVPGAQWIRRPNGHPVVRVHGDDVDVTRLVHEHLRGGSGSLLATVDRYAGGR